MKQAHTRLFPLLLIGSTALIGLSANAQDAYPSQPIKLVVPYNAGGGTDTIARHLSDRLSKAFNQPVIVENKPGANGIIGTRSVATAKPDGYTYALVVNSHLINPLVSKELPYDTFKDFIGVTMVARSPLVFLSSASMPIKNIQDFLEQAQKPDSKFAYGSSENMTRLVGDMFNYYNKLNMVSISYSGGAPLMADVAGGITTMATGSLLSSSAYVQSGKLTPLAVTGQSRTQMWPNVPTMTELGLKEFDNVYVTYSIFAPAKTPKAILDKMQKTVALVINQPEMKEILQKQAAEPVGNSVESFNQQVEKDFELWRKLAVAIDLKPA